MSSLPLVNPRGQNRSDSSLILWNVSIFESLYLIKLIFRLGGCLVK